MLITETKLRKLIRKILIEARIKPSFDHKSAFNQWLETVFLGDETNFAPFTNAVYSRKSKRDNLKKRWKDIKGENAKLLKNSGDKFLFYDYLKSKVDNNNNIFNKEMIGDFFMENTVNPICYLNVLKFFIKPVKDFSKFSKTKIPSFRASSPDLKFIIDDKTTKDDVGNDVQVSWENFCNHIEEMNVKNKAQFEKEKRYDEEGRLKTPEDMGSASVGDYIKGRGEVVKRVDSDEDV